MSKPRETTVQSIRALERYRLNAMLVRQAFHAHWSDHPNPERADRGDPGDPEFFAWLSMWYSTEWVVWEGCQALGLELNLKVDLMRKYSSLLYKFRSMTFHPQPEFPPREMMRYIEDEDSVAWMYALRSEMAKAIRAKAKDLGMTPNASGFYL